MKVAIVTWQGGGATQPALGLGRLLAEAGHGVRILGPAGFAGRVASAGCSHRPLPATLEFDPSRGRAAEEQDDYLDATFFGLGFPTALAEELAEEPAEVVVVDYLLRTTICQAEALGVSTVVLLHMTHRFHGVLYGGDEKWGWRWSYRQVNAARAALGLEALPIGPEPSGVALTRRAAAGLVAMPREFDPWPEDAPPRLVHAGPIFEEAGTASWDPPWPAGDERPLVLVSLGSTYMHQEELLTRIALALNELPVRALVLTGNELDPDELELGAGVEVRDFVPHSAVVPEAALVLTHAGVGTLMAAFAAGVPTLCVPLGRDQPENAERVEELGAGAVLSAQANMEEIREAIAAALASAELRAGAARMATAVAGYETPALALATVEAAARA